jgi:uncharacterized membrane protein
MAPATLRKLAFALLAIASLGVAGYAVVAYSLRPLGSLVHPDMRATYNAHAPWILTHVFASAVTLLLGPWQFIASVRTRWPRFHRVTGRLYLGLGVLAGGLAALYMSFFAFGGTVSTSGFALLAVGWLATGAMALHTARAGDFAAHRRWMIRNFALALAAVTLRLGLAGGFASGMRFETFYPWLAWLSWMPNLVIAEWIIMATYGRRADTKAPNH